MDYEETTTEYNKRYWAWIYAGFTREWAHAEALKSINLRRRLQGLEPLVPKPTIIVHHSAFGTWRVR